MRAAAGNSPGWAGGAPKPGRRRVQAGDPQQEWRSEGWAGLRPVWSLDHLPPSFLQGNRASGKESQLPKVTELGLKPRLLGRAASHLCGPPALHL